MKSIEKALRISDIYESLRAFLSKSRHTNLSLSISRESSWARRPQFQQFHRDNGFIIPCLKNYRWSLKKGWKTIAPLGIFDQLHSLGVLETKDLAFLRSCVNNHTITRSIAEINEYFAKAYSRYSGLLVGSNPQSVRVLPLRKERERKVNNSKKAFIQLFSNMAKSVLLPPSRQAKILEVGYTSGGYSLFALERLGFTAIGIDNFYDGTLPESVLHQELAKKFNSKVFFQVGDICRKTTIEEKSIDFIVTTSVLEHILDVQSAMNEFYRILKPGGAMYHSYDPYFHPLGGHSLGVLDSPWAHLRLSTNEYARYIDEVRPYEKQIACSWYQSGLNRDYPSHKMMQILAQTGFEIASWQTSCLSSRDSSCLTYDIVSDALVNYPNISIVDLISTKHCFIALRPS